MIVVLVLLLATGVWLMAVAIRRASSRRPWSERTTAVLAYAALGWTVLTAAVLAVAPLVTTESVGATSGSSTVMRSTVTSSTVTHDSLVESEGAGVVLVLLVPVAVALVGAMARGRAARHVRIGAGCVLPVLCVLGAASIGVFYLPAPVLLLVAGFKTPGDALGPRPAVPRSG